MNIAGYDLNWVGIICACVMGYSSIKFVSLLFWNKRDKEKTSFPDEQLYAVFAALAILCIFGINR